MQQRLGLAQALIGEPRLLLLDEPTSALDPAGRIAVRALLEELRRRGIAVLLNSHLLSEVELVCDHVVIISQGATVASGTPADLARKSGVEIETAAGVRTFAQATRDDVPRIVAELVAAGEQIYDVTVIRSTLEEVYLEAIAGESVVNGVVTIARYAIQESLRRRVFVVVLILSVGFLALFAWGTSAAFDEVQQHLDFGETPFHAAKVAGGFLLGLAMFAILFLGSVLAVFLTLGAVRGDAERGLLQPIIVRPISRTAVLGGRFLASAAVCSAYVVVMFVAASAITRWAGGQWPDRMVVPALGLAGAVALLSALSILGSVYLSATANGIAVFMLFGGGLVGGLLRQIGEALPSKRLERAGTITSWGLPFDALYQNSLYGITATADGVDRVIIKLGPFGGAQAGGGALWLWSLAYLVIVGAIASRAFSRRDL